MGGKDRSDKETSHKHKSSHHHHHHSSSRHHRHHHHHHHHSHRDDRKDKDRDSRRDRDSHRSPRRSHKEGGRAGNRRGPSSSVGPGRVEPVLLVILVLLGISAVVFLSLSIWLYAVRNGWPSGLNQTGSITWTRLISYATALLLVGILFIPIILLSVASSLTQTGSSARKLRLALVVLVSIASVILAMMTITSLLFSANGPLFISNALEQSWSNTVGSGNFRVACHIQQTKRCFGWYDNSCRGCRPTVSGDYAGCTSSQVDVCPRCYRRTRQQHHSGNKKKNKKGSARVAYRKPVSAVPVRSRPRNREQSRNAVISKLDAAVTGALRRLRAIHAGARRRLRAASGSRKQAMRQKSSKQTNDDYEFGCGKYVIWRNREFFIPMTVYTIFLILLLTLLSWKACIDSSGRYQ